MKTIRKYAWIAGVAMLTACKETTSAQSQPLLLRDVTLIDGNGGAPQEHVDILMQDGNIARIGTGLDTNGVSVLRLSGKTVMPALISAHVHVGTLKDSANDGRFYTRENVLRHLEKYQDFGVLQVLVMGTDRPLLFESGLADSSLKGLAPGARLYSAGYGFGVSGGAPPAAFGMDLVQRPATPEEAAAQVAALARLPVKTIKMWVDNAGPGKPKMDPSVYHALIGAAHENGMKAAAHLYYIADAKQLVKDGIDIIAHSIRDREVDDTLVAEMKEKGVVYIPTLALDKFAVAYGDTPAWVNDPFFRKSLEPGALAFITSPQYKNNIRNNPNYPDKIRALETALKNAYKLHKAGVLVALGTDSGASPARAQGFSEHLELVLLVEAGFTPLEAITVGTKNAAKALRVDADYGTVEVGKKADLLVLNENPALHIEGTQSIYGVFKAGREVSKGPMEP
ncbi:amidohydrolase family protein [Chitinophaga caseinilytica]|uniref:amidohydrolase family protein n=1 Tax=Chitinophaga caseinilytica TaxID=2267521 RepID=UPI003C2CA6D0